MDQSKDSQSTDRLLRQLNQIVRCDITEQQWHPDYLIRLSQQGILRLTVHRLICNTYWVFLSDFMDYDHSCLLGGYDF